jgi:hypothetical protein
MNRAASRDAEWELAFAGEINEAVLQEFGRGYWADVPVNSLEFAPGCETWPDLLSPRQQQLSPVTR